MTTRKSIAIVGGCVALIAVLAAALVLAYGIRLRASAEQLVRSARDVRSTADVHRITEMWRHEYGRKFTERGAYDGDCTYEVVLTNEFLHKLHLVPFTYLLASVMTKDHQLGTVIVSMDVEPPDNIQKLILVQEYFSASPTLFRVQRLPDDQTQTVSRVKVLLSSGVPESQRSDAFNVNTSCLVRFYGCETTQQMLPAVKQIAALGHM